MKLLCWSHAAPTIEQLRAIAEDAGTLHALGLDAPVRGTVRRHG